MAPSKPWYVRAKEGFLRFWRTENPKLGALRDILVAAVVVLFLLSIVWVYTGQPFPSQAPLVVIESGSMMHGPQGPCLERNTGCADFETPFFGRWGTIDPGDLVLVKDIDDYDDLETAFDPDADNHYGAAGDVIVFHRDATGEGTPVIHRAMLLVIVGPDGCQPNGTTNRCTYRIPETCNDRFAEFVRPGSDEHWPKYCEGHGDPLTLRLERGGLFLRLDNYPCPAAQLCRTMEPLRTGLFTKGDNNHEMDQPTPFTGRAGPADVTCCLVPIDQVIGVARGEIAWFGLLKLTLYDNELYNSENDPTDKGQLQVLRAEAPWDLWVGLVVGIGILIGVPIGTDYVIDRVRKARERRKTGQPPPSSPPPEDKEGPPPSQ